MEFANGRHGFIPFYEFLKIMQNIGYENMEKEDLLSALLFNRSIALDYEQYLDQRAVAGEPSPNIAAFRPCVLRSRLENRVFPKGDTTNYAFTFLEAGYMIPSPVHDSGTW